MKDRPPSLARATARVSLETACMMAETMGMFKLMGHSSSPLRYFTQGVFRETLSGTHSSDVNPGTSRYSLKVWEGSE